jgi:hypothetical protein
MRNLQKCKTSHEEIPNMHKIPLCAYLEVPHGICAFFGSSSWDFVHFGKFLMGFCAYLEVPHWILCIFGSSS